MGDGGGGGREVSPREFFGSEILAKRDIFGFMKDTGICFGLLKKPDFFGYGISHQLKPTIT